MANSASLSDIFFSILAGIISSAIVLLLQIFVPPLSQEIHLWVRRVRIYSPLWGFFKSKKVFVISGSLLSGVLSQNPLPALAEPDEIPVNEVIATMRLLRPRTQLDRMYSHSIPEEIIKKDIIAVGGPAYNHIAKKMDRFISKFVTFPKKVPDDKKPEVFFTVSMTRLRMKLLSHLILTRTIL